MGINQVEKSNIEKKMMVFCPNCVNKESSNNNEENKKTLKEIIERLSKPIPSLKSNHDGERYLDMIDDWQVIKHYHCPECRERYIASYLLKLESNLTLQQGFKGAKEDGMLFNTYRVEN